MTKKQLRRVVIVVVTFYALCIVAGFALSLSAPLVDTPFYSTYRDMLWFTLAIPAALLSYAFQQRVSYLTSLRGLWSKLVQSVNMAIQYTYDEEPSEQNYTETMIQLAMAIDEVRGVYCNVGERKGNVGLYPYEPIKEIYNLIQGLGYGQLDPVKRNHARDEIFARWQTIRSAFLAEFDRAEPTKPIVAPRST